MQNKEIEHAFGGVWTLEKLDAISQYMIGFNKVLKNQNFGKIYIDAFAGTGNCTIKSNNTELTVNGSAHRAVKCIPQFDHLYFIEKSLEKSQTLSKTLASTDKRVHIINDDANEAVLQLINNIEWGYKNRGLLFLDPFGMNFDWNILKSVAQTKAVDVWYLFPIFGVMRQSAKDFDQIDNAKAKSIDYVLGTVDWREKFYTEKSSIDMIDGEVNKKERHINNEGMINFVKNRLGEIFPLVLEPAILKNSKNGLLFALFFVCSNTSTAAQGAAGRIATALISKLNKGQMATIEKEILRKKSNPNQQNLFD
ncbi:MAG: three-Cys-motif partner protein TcmP [Agitococcus sp.]|nr:three-Cys-motif partner protein TcmP [Agitococcus sp.]